MTDTVDAKPLTISVSLRIEGTGEANPFTAEVTHKLACDYSELNAELGYTIGAALLGLCPFDDPNYGSVWPYITRCLSERGRVDTNHIMEIAARADEIEEADLSLSAAEVLRRAIAEYEEKWK